MDHRIVIATAVGLVLIALAGFYFAFGKRLHGPEAPPAQTAAAAKPGAPEQAAQGSAAPATAAGKATFASIEAEIARSDHADLQALLKRHFADDYRQLIEVAVQRRNEGVSDQAFGQELFGRFQEIMRSKLKFAVAASTSTIDRLAANEIGLFHTLGTEGAAYCLKVLGKDEAPVTTPPPESVRRLLRLGTLYRFQAIVEGMGRPQPIEPLAPDELATFEATLARAGLRLDEVRSGAFLGKEGNEPGKPCLMIEKLYRTIGQIGEGTRRKLYSGMFFLGRDN